MRLRVVGVLAAAVAAVATPSLPAATAATPLIIATTALAPVYEGTAVSVPLKASGGGFVKGWRVAGGELPAGMTLTSAGYLKGTPTGAGVSSFDVQVTSGAQASAPQSLTWQVKAMEITTPSLGTVPVDQNMRVTQLTVKGGTSPYTWSIVAGHLPNNIAMTSGGRISGASHFSGISTVTVAVTDVKHRTATREYQIEVLPMAIISPGLPQGTRGRFYSASLQVSGGKGTLVWTIDGGVLPPGLKLSTGGTITGVPTAAGNYTVRIGVRETGILPNGAERTFLMIVN